MFKIHFGSEPLISYISFSATEFLKMKNVCWNI